MFGNYLGWEDNSEKQQRKRQTIFYSEARPFATRAALFFISSLITTTISFAACFLERWNLQKILGLLSMLCGTAVPLAIAAMVALDFAHSLTLSAYVPASTSIVSEQLSRGFRRYNFGLPLPPPLISSCSDDDLNGFSMLRLPPGLRETVVSTESTSTRYNDKIVYTVENPGWRTCYPVSQHKGVITIQEGSTPSTTLFTWDVSYTPLPGGKVFVDFMTRSIVSACFSHVVSSSTQAQLFPEDYLMTDSLALVERPTLLSSLCNPRDALASTLILIGIFFSALNVFNNYGEPYLLASTAAILFGGFSAIVGLVQVTTGYMITRHDRPGIADDAAVTMYGAIYTGSVTWLALRASEVCPLWLPSVDCALAPMAVAAFSYGVYAPISTLLRSSDVLTETELLRVRGLVAIGVLGAVFVPDCLAFAIGSQDWWVRVTSKFALQKTLESSTSLFAVFATEASMVAHRAGKVGVATYNQIVPVFVVVCFFLAILPVRCREMHLEWHFKDLFTSSASFVAVCLRLAQVSCELVVKRWLLNKINTHTYTYTLYQASREAKQWHQSTYTHTSICCSHSSQSGRRHLFLLILLLLTSKKESLFEI